MELNELKSTWKKSELELKSPSELQKMTQINHHPMLKRIRAKLMIESILLVVFISVYYNMFDGHEKPLWANVLLVISAFLYVLNDLLGYLNSKNLRLTENTKKTLDQLIIKLKRLSIFSILSSLFFGVSILLFFTSSVEITVSKMILFSGMTVTLLILNYISLQTWTSRIARIKEITKELM